MILRGLLRRLVNFRLCGPEPGLMSQEHLIFPRVPRGFWSRFRRRWAEPLQILEEVITLCESLGADPTSPRFEVMDETYSAVLRSLHSRTCLHARAVLALLANGLVDPTWAQWRICHESSTIARFIANSPEMASRYMDYSLVNKYHLAKELYDSDRGESPTKPELDELNRMSNSVKSDLRKAYGHKSNSKDYAWSGLRNFREIEATVFQAEEWNPRGEYILASERIHSAPNAGEPHQVGENPPVFVVGPTNGGLTGPADLTSLSIVAATEALMLRAFTTIEDDKTLEELVVKRRMVGAMCWLLDPEIFCQDCGGHELGASPPDLIPIDERPEPCSCR